MPSWCWPFLSRNSCIQVDRGRPSETLGSATLPRPTTAVQPLEIVKTSKHQPEPFVFASLRAVLLCLGVKNNCFCNFFGSRLDFHRRIRISLSFSQAGRRNRWLGASYSKYRRKSTTVNTSGTEYIFTRFACSLLLCSAAAMCLAGKSTTRPRF